MLRNSHLELHVDRILIFCLTGRDLDLVGSGVGGGKLSMTALTVPVLYLFK